MSSSFVDPDFDVMQIVQLLSTLSLEEQNFLQHRMEFHDFVRSATTFSKLVRDIRRHHRTPLLINGCCYKNGNFLQQDAVDDIVLRVFDFLDTQSLVRVSECCSRFHDLVTRNAIQRTRTFAKERQLETPLALLRAMEEVQGIESSNNSNNLNTILHVRVPTLLPHRRIYITQAGDADYNGIYYCTGCNGNGFVFTKPRFPEQRVPVRREITINAVATEIDQDVASVDSDIDMTEGRLLRCVIAKRFSNETILWYMSKEIIGIEEGNMVDDEEDDAEEDAMGHARTTDPNAITQVFSFWARLMVIGDAPSDICRYPSQSSILARRHPADGWQSLSTTLNLHPPTVELLD